MTIALYIRRLNQLRHVRGLLEAAQSIGIDCVGLADQSLSGKPDEFPALCRLPDGQPWESVEWKRVVGFREAEQRAQDAGAGALVVPSPLGVHRSGVLPVCGLQTTVSDCLDCEDGAVDVYYGWTETWARLRATWREPWMSTRFAAVGAPIQDFVPHYLGQSVPWSRPAVVLAPFPFGSVPRHWWSHGVYGGPWPGLPTDRVFIRRLRSWCDRIGAVLVVKTRPKTPAPAYLLDRADYAWDRDEPGEARMLEALMHADSLVHFISLSATEAAIAGVPALCLTLRRWPAYAPRMALDDLSLRPRGMGSLYAWPGVSFADFADRWHEPRWPPAAVDFTARRAYVDRYLGSPGAGFRVVNDLRALA